MPARKRVKRELSVPEKHMLKIARATLRMPDAMARVMGGPSKEEARRIIRDLTKSNPRRKRNFTIGLPRNKWVNAQVMVTSGGKIRAKVSESVLGHAGIGGSAQLPKLNPTTRTGKHKVKPGYMGSFASMMRARRTKAQVGKGYGTDRNKRYWVYLKSGGPGVYARTFAGAKKKGKQLVKRAGLHTGGFNIQNQVTSQITTFEVTP